MKINGFDQRKYIQFPPYFVHSTSKSHTQCHAVILYFVHYCWTIKNWSEARSIFPPTNSVNYSTLALLQLVPFFSFSFLTGIKFQLAVLCLSSKYTCHFAYYIATIFRIVQFPCHISAVHCESGGGLWSKGCAASQKHSWEYRNFSTWSMEVAPLANSFPFH